MDIQQVIEKFAMIANLTLEETVPWFSLCEEALSEVESHIREGIDLNGNGRRLNSAAAALGFYRYTLYRASGEGMESFSAGDIKVTSDKKSSVESAYRVWKDAKASAADLLKDDNFLFEGIYKT